MIRYDRLQKAFFLAFTGAAPLVGWAYGENPREAEDLISMSLAAGPATHNRQHARGEILCPADSVRIRVTAVTVDSRQIIRLNDFDVFHDVTGADTLTTIRDALLAKIDEPNVTAVAFGADSIDLTATDLGDLRRLNFPSQDNDLVGENAVFSGDAVLETIGTKVHTLRIQAFSHNREPRNDAHSILVEILDRLQKVGVVTEIQTYGVAVWGKGTPVDLAAIRGANWESRAALDVVIAARSVAVEPVDQIETVNAITVIDATTVTATATKP